jgi:DNA ligase-associated metallophosphoesterase
MQLRLLNSDFTLLPEKALFKEDERLLIIADVHLGKAGHFRKEGFSLPQKAQMTDYENLRKLFEKIQPEKVYFLGDLFHSKINGDWKYFAELIQSFPGIAFTLIKGNHDIIDPQLFADLGIEIVPELLQEHNIVYSHMPVSVQEGQVNIVGHIHPGILLSGKAKQSVRLPCYHLCGNTLLLPAFGRLTGLYMIDCKAEDRVFGVLPAEVVEL